jgi:AcrR family transcriptional regulator
MQETLRRTQKERSDTMRATLLRSGRALFVRQGYTDTSTPEIVASAGVTRGALYHHFADKAALFEAVIRAEAEAVAAAIEDAEFGGLSPIETLVQGGEAYLAAMRAPGRTQLMLVQAPAVLPPEVLASIDASTGGRTLAEGLAAAGISDPGPLSALLSAAYDRAALAIDAGAAPGPWRAALERLVRGAVR